MFPDKLHGGRVFYNEAIMSSLGIPQVGETMLLMLKIAGALIQGFDAVVFLAKIQPKW